MTSTRSASGASSGAPRATRTPRTRRKQARPAELVSAALTLFVEKGFAATSVEEIAQSAGVSKGTLFLYFQSKEELFKAVVRENISSALREGFDEVRLWTGSTADLVPRLMLQWWRSYGNMPAGGITKLMMSEARNFPSLAAFYQQEVVSPAQELIRLTLQRGIRRGEFRRVNVDLALYAILSPIMFLIMWKHSLGACMPADAAIDPEKCLRMQADIVVRGLLKPAAPRKSPSAEKLRA
jgi:TetR/AcrR family transcriptional regulator